MPLGRVVALVGGFALLAAYAMPWFGVSVSGQGVLLSGQFLGRFLSGTNDLSRVMPGAAGGPNEVRLLLGLVYLFPACGALAALVAAATAWRARRARWNALLLLTGVVPLAALAIGLGRLPPGASPELGLWVIGAGALAVVLGALLDGLSDRRPAAS
ncbi:MAG TPA: hypothetical protein VGM69_09410 [Chloroflexota bacterium]